MTNVVSRSVTNHILRFLVEHLAPPSRLITPSANKLITSLDLSRCTQPRFILDFRSAEGRADVQGWYNRQGRTNRFTLLEYRKDKVGQFKHEFIVVWLNSTTLCRFDRRARDGERGYVLRDEGAPAEDSAHILSSFETEYQELLEQTEVLMSVKLLGGEDLGVILAVCEGIQSHSRAATYNLMRYNCYFFSWMIATAVARRTYNWESNVLSKEGWDKILQDSLASIFPAPITDPRRDEPVLPAILPRQTSLKLWFKRTITKLRTRFLHNANPEPSEPPNRSDLEDYQEALRSGYSDSHNIIERTLSKLLLRSQLGPALRRELGCIEKSSFFAAKCTIAENKVRKAVLQRDTFPPILYLDFLASGRRTITPHINRYRYSQLKLAAKAAVEMLSANDNSWERAWQDAWTSTPPNDQQYEWLEREHTCIRIHILPPSPLQLLHKWLPSAMDAFAKKKAILKPARSRTNVITPLPPFFQDDDRDNDSYSPKQPYKTPRIGIEMGNAAIQAWETMGHKALYQWKSAWNECDKLSAQYGTVITTTVMATILERLGDVPPEQLTFGSTLKRREDLDGLEDPPSLQDFIRSRMQGHFEMVDRFGFGSFEELVTTAEEVMCEIWVASLDIVESDRYRPQYLTGSHTMA
ncbi:hypothetical protein FRC11_012056 [Ceratobasidium sp. 423]|nr:hypothetical protein FRC11_012056 [Ceratobasidium sp. 423]